MDTAPTTTAGEEHTLVPRPVVVLVVLALTGFLGADVIGQFLVAGHAASPVLDGAILAVLGGVVAASRGPQPAKPDQTDKTGPDPESPASSAGRHREGDNA